MHSRFQEYGMTFALADTHALGSAPKGRNDISLVLCCQAPRGEVGEMRVCSHVFECGPFPRTDEANVAVPPASRKSEDYRDGPFWPSPS